MLASDWKDALLILLGAGARLTATHEELRLMLPRLASQAGYTIIDERSPAAR
jgi:hypothetical protein